MPLLEIEPFKVDFDRLTATWDWEVEGFIDKSGFVYPIDSDTKVISTVFERLSSPVIRTIAKHRGYTVETANQTTYPDFTLSHPVTRDRVAIDIKTTYLSARMNMTLGGYASFLRNNTKNILYPYDTYREHWILGFVYQQRGVFEEYDLENMPKAGAIPCPYIINRIFLRKKHEISGLRAGSGNTKNIGSIFLRRAEDFQVADGPFAIFEFSREACDYYWKAYERLCPDIRTVEDLREHREFQQFRPLRSQGSA